MTERAEPSARFDAVRAELVAGDRRIRPWSWFGLQAVSIEGEVFAAVAYGRLVVKLGRPRVDQLVAAGAGERFQPSGRPFGEWLHVADPGADWPALASEARDFVSASA